MLQYIINESLIWLACLVVYELLLRRESFHQYNRVYLLASLVIGLLLPLANLNSLVPANNKVFHTPAEQVYELKKAVFSNEVPTAPVTATAPAPVARAVPEVSQFSPERMLWVIYLLGVALGLVLIAREAFQLIRLYAQGRKSTERGCIVVETGKDHCPFSFFNIVFIGNRQDYTIDQWTILIAHEKEHSRQLHSLDNLLLITLRIVFWFHPLPHIYYKRLMMVHEFQADAVAAKSPTDYGTFLLEQSLLQGAPVLTHSFNYSPIKNRIAMLTGTRSTRAKLLKYLAVIPLSLILILFCTQISFSGGSSTKWNKAYFKGNEIVFGTFKVCPFEYAEALEKQKKAFLYAALPDSIAVKDWKTGYMVMRPVPRDTTAVVINGKPIYGEEVKYEISNGKSIYLPPVFKGQDNDPVQYLFAQLKRDLNKLDNGIYYIDLNRIVIDERGELAYYESRGIVSARGWGGRAFSFIDNDLKKSIDNKLFDLLEGSIKFRPAMNLDGKPINVRLETRLYDIEVEGHQAKLVPRRGGC